MNPVSFEIFNIVFGLWLLGWLGYGLSSNEPMAPFIYLMFSLFSILAVIYIWLICSGVMGLLS